MTNQPVTDLQQLAQKYPGKDEFELYVLDQVERILTYSRDQTKYLHTISTIFVIAFILSLIIGFLSLIL
jgi:hypothetical protein